MNPIAALIASGKQISKYTSWGGRGGGGGGGVIPTCNIQCACLLRYVWYIIFLGTNVTTRSIFATVQRIQIHTCVPTFYKLIFCALDIFVAVSTKFAKLSG